MKKMVIGFFLVILAGLLVCGQMRLSHGLNPWASDSGYYYTLSGYYGYPQDVIMGYKTRGISEPELPLLFFVAKHAHVAPDGIARMRLAGQSWGEITSHYHVNADVFYVDMGDANFLEQSNNRLFGIYRSNPGGRWAQVRLMDDDMIYLANLHCISGYHHVSPVDVGRMYSQGRAFRALDQEYGSRNWEQKNPGQTEGRKKYSFEGK